MPTSQIFKPQAPISFGTPSLGTPAAAPKVNPAITSGLSIGAGGQPLVNGQTPTPYVAPQSTNPTAAGFTPSSAATALTSALLPTSSGGVSIPVSHTAAYNSPTQTQTSQQQTPSLSDYYTSTTPTSGGGNLTTNANGVPVGYAPSAGYSIDTSGATPSDALTGQNTASGLQNSYKSLQDYVNAVSQAQGYSPDYLQAQQNVYGTQAQGAQLGVNNAAFANEAYGSNQANNGGGLNYGSLGGASTDYVAGTIGGQQSGNAIQQSLNAQQQTNANIALNTQQLARTGAISSAQTQLQYAPGAVAQQNAQSQYNTLAQQYAGINPPAFDPNSDGITQLQNLHSLIAKSPAYLAGFQSTYTTPGGGTGIYNKLNTSGLTQNADGTLSLVNAGQAALQGANATALGTQVQNYNNVQTSFNTANKTLSTMIGFMQANGINDNSTPILNQLENKAKAGLINPGAIAAYQADIAELDTNYATILARGGSVAGTNDAASSLINPNLKPADLQKVLSQLQQNGQNALDATGSQISQLTNQLGGQSSGYSTGSTSIGSGWGSLGD